MNWQILITISIFFMSLGTVLQRLVVKSKTRDPIAFSILFQLVVGTIIGVYGSINENMSLPDIYPLLPGLILMVVLWGLANIFNFKALQITEASVFTIIFSSRAFFTTVAVSYFFKEYLNVTQWLGAILIMAGIIIVSFNRSKVKLNRNMVFSLFTAVFFGLANANDRFLLKSFNLYPYITIAYIFPALGVAVYSPKSIGRIKEYLNKEYLYKIILIGLVYSVSSITFFRALQIAPNSSQVVNVSVSGVVVTVIMSALILKEHDRMIPKIAGSLLSLIGVLLVS